MRHMFLASALLLSACATAPQPPKPIPAPVTQEPHIRSGLIGMSAAELVSRLGNPALQIREGSSVKLQFRNARCVLDAYLYPETGKALRVAHIDTRAPSGIDTNQAVCIATFETAS